ncbi:MAG: aldo/keto reductase [Candidatus Latescibacteria bacterium]|nr:aldo/keto reductase [Candidatus Latescibacterota bacterium]
MEYRRLGKAGIKVSELSFGSWITFGNQLDVDNVKKCMRAAYEAGVNFFDNAEVYANGVSESIMGEALKEYKREELVVSTKIFWGGKAPNQEGLSRKHLIEGTLNSLKRLQLDYVDLIYCHRPDPETPVEETVLAMDYIVRSGYAFYWGTSEWPAYRIEEAFAFAREYRCIPPSMEQPQYNMFVRERFEKEYAPLYEKYHYGTTIWSPLASGLLTGKYTKGIPEGSRLASVDWLRGVMQRDGYFSKETVEKIESLLHIAKNLGCTLAQLALAWCLKNVHVSTVITGASRVEQVKENMKAIDVKTELDDNLMNEIEKILNNKPQ